MLQEHIRQSRENRLDEIGRRATPCPVSVSRTDLRDRGSESPSVEVDSGKELIPTTLIAHEYTKELVLEMKYGTKEMNDIHQSNNVSNATQERLQESSEEPEMCDSSCQTRESLFDPRIPDAVLPSPAFSTFGYRSVSSSQKGVALNHRGTPQSQQCHQHHYHHHHQHQTSRQGSQQSQQSNTSNSPTSRHPVSERCSACTSTVASRDGSMAICPKHNPIPAPPGWSLHDPPYPQIVSGGPDGTEYPTYQRYQSPKPDREPIGSQQSQHHSPLLTRQNTVGSGERYGSFIYGSGRASSNTASNTTTTTSNTTGSGSQHSGTPKYTNADPRYRAEAVIEVDQKRPFSIESTKSAPDVIATHWRRGAGDWEPYRRRHPRQNFEDDDITLNDKSDKCDFRRANMVSVATQSSLDDDTSTTSTVEISSSWSTYPTGSVQPAQIASMNIPSEDSLIVTDLRRNCSIKLNQDDDQLILKPPEKFRSSNFVTGNSSKHCCCLGHSHFASRRPSMPCCILKRCTPDTFYRTWPSRTIRMIGRTTITHRTIGTQSSIEPFVVNEESIDGDTSRAIWLTGPGGRRKTLKPEEVGASIPFWTLCK